MYMNHSRALRVKADMIDKIDYKRIMEMYKDRFKDAGDFTFLFVGNITLDEAKPLIETYLGGLPTIHRTENFRDTKMDIRKGKYTNVFSKKLETPLASVLIIASGKCEYTLKNDVLMSFLTQSLDKVYLESVREKEGGSYGVSVYGQLSRYPNDDEAFLQIYFDTDPDALPVLPYPMSSSKGMFHPEPDPEPCYICGYKPGNGMLQSLLC